jgi:hypothetical protein
MLVDTGIPMVDEDRAMELEVYHCLELVALHWVGEVHWVSCLDLAALYYGDVLHLYGLAMSVLPYHSN